MSPTLIAGNGRQFRSDVFAWFCAVHVQNKLVYTEIFAKYTELIEGFLEQRLKQVRSFPFVDAQIRSVGFYTCSAPRHVHRNRCVAPASRVPHGRLPDQTTVLF